MNLGFTGTQDGMTLAQEYAVYRLCRAIHKRYYIDEFHHGDCVGADRQAHKIIRRLNNGIVIVGHPPVVETKRAFCKFNIELPPLAYISRNHKIVDSTKVMIACPKSAVEELRSGTWATVRYARKLGRKVYIVTPDGKVKRSWK